MYILKRNEDLILNFARTRELRKWAEDTLADASAGLSFMPEEHRYFLNGKELTCVSDIVEHFAPFDGESMARKCSANPKHPMYGKTVEEILQLWKQNGAEAASAGTNVHEFCEACFLYMTGQDELIDEKFRERLTEEGLVALDPKEESAAKWWEETDWNRFVPIAKETRVVNVQLGYAGTFDLLLWDLYTQSFAVRDWKTNKDLTRWFGEMLLPPLTMIRSNDIGKYTVQQTLYTVVLRRLGMPVTANILIWLRQDGYVEYPLELRYDKIIEWAAMVYLKENNNNS